jgi:hypothetical protein
MQVPGVPDRDDANNDSIVVGATVHGGQTGVEQDDIRRVF